MPNADAHPPLVWIDVETTGADARVLEIAALVTDAQLELVAEGPALTIHQDDAEITEITALAALDERQAKRHADSGLLDDARASTLSVGDAQRELLEFLTPLCPPRASPLCGARVLQARQALVNHMPQLSEFLHYRVIDVSSIRELAGRWYPALEPPTLTGARARDNVRAALAALRSYKVQVFQ